MRLKQKLLLIGSIILAITGCSTNNPPLKSSLNVPAVSKVTPLIDRNSIALEWSLVDKPNIVGYYIQRSEDAKKYKTIAKIEDKYVTHYTDTNLKPNKKYFYKISTYTKNGVPSVGKLLEVKTDKTIEPIAYIADSGLRVKGMIKFIFRPHTNERVAGYYIEKFNDKEAKWQRIAQLPNRLRAEYIDKNLIDGKVYRYRVIAYTYDGLVSPPSKELVIQTLQKPQMITTLKVTTNLAKRIEISWQKVEDAKEYKIYYSDDGDDYELLTTTTNNKHTDTINNDGYKRYYIITSINKYGLESIPSQPVMGLTLSIPLKPIVSIEKKDSAIKFILSSPDKRAKKYLILKDDGTKITKIHNVKNGYEDKKLKHQHRYSYKIYAIDENGLISNPTELEVNF
jgi:fibronectin type 3 domain-containing protein